MDKAQIAERFLSLVMERARAAAVVGDLLEVSPSHGTFWFWSNVLETWTANVWREWTCHPRFVFRVAAYGTLLQVGIGLAVSIVFSVGLPIAIRGLANPHMFRVISTWLWIGRILVLLVCPFFVGRWIARFTLGKDVAICVAMAILTPVALSVLRVGLWFCLVVFQGRPPHLFTWWSSWEMWFFVPYLLGAILSPSQRRTEASS